MWEPYDSDHTYRDISLFRQVPELLTGWAWAVDDSEELHGGGAAAGAVPAPRPPLLGDVGGSEAAAQAEVARNYRNRIEAAAKAEVAPPRGHGGGDQPPEARPKA